MSRWHCNPWKWCPGWMVTWIHPWGTDPGSSVCIVLKVLISDSERAMKYLRAEVAECLTKGSFFSSCLSPFIFHAVKSTSWKMAVAGNTCWFACRRRSQKEAVRRRWAQGEKAWRQHPPVGLKPIFFIGRPSFCLLKSTLYICGKGTEMV